GGPRQMCRDPVPGGPRGEGRRQVNRRFLLALASLAISSAGCMAIRNTFFAGQDLAGARPALETALSIPEADRKNSACHRAYARLYKNDIVDMRLVFGYKDARPARFVADRYERAAIV